jgi:hypothetical protein
MVGQSRHRIRRRRLRSVGGLRITRRTSGSLSLAILSGGAPSEA